MASLSRIPLPVLRNRASVADYFSMLDSMADVIDAADIAAHKARVRRAWLDKVAAAGHPFVLPYYSGMHTVPATDDCGDHYEMSTSTARLYRKGILREW
jgi:hypothetical protein